MIISCPSCGASFNVKAEALGPNGRSVKCSKCAHRWHATADGGPAPEEAATAQASAAEAASADPAAEPTGEGDSPAAETATGENDQETGEVATDEPQPAVDETGQSSDEADAEPSPEMREALGLAADPDTTADDDAPEVQRRKRKNGPPRKSRRSVAKVLSIFIFMLLIGGAGSTAVLMKQEIMMWLPATQRLYAMIGMKPEVLGHGLQIGEPVPKKEIDGNDEILVVEGQVRNIAEKPVEIPLMRGALLNKEGKELHIWTFTAARSQIRPGEAAQYRTEFRNPPPDAQSLDITFTRTQGGTGSMKREVKQESKADSRETRQH